MAKRDMLSRFWDSHIGRSGIIGEGLEMFGLGTSGTTADRKSGLLRALDFDISEIQENNELTKQKLWETFKTRTFNSQRKGGGLLSSIMNSGNVATDTGRNANRINAIQNTIRATNEDYSNTVIKNMDRDKITADRVQVLDTKKENIRGT